MTEGKSDIEKEISLLVRALARDLLEVGSKHGHTFIDVIFNEHPTIGRLAKSVLNEGKKIGLEKLPKEGDIESYAVKTGAKVTQNALVISDTVRVEENNSGL